MEYLLSNAVFYLAFAFITLIFLTSLVLLGKVKGGKVIKRLSANITALNSQFKHCSSMARYNILVPGKPDRIKIKLWNIPLSEGEELELLLNDFHLANIYVNANAQAKFTHWSDEGVDFPAIKENDTLVIRHNSEPVLTGTFQLD